MATSGHHTHIPPSLLASPCLLFSLLFISYCHLEPEQLLYADCIKKDKSRSHEQLCIIVFIFSIPCRAQNICLIYQYKNILGMKYLLSGYFLHQLAISSIRYCCMGVFIYILISQYQNTDAGAQRHT